ncbi:MAG: Cna B-type domain-containing protein [Oscillospiraceae bacterium]
MTRRKRTLALLATVLCLLTSVAQAAGSIDLTRKPTLTLTYRDGKTALSGAKFSIYRVADADETGELTVRSEFDEFDLDIRGKNDRRWREMAQTLESYVLRREFTPTDSGKTDKTGMLTFPTQGKTLAAGLYLVIGERHTQGGNDYDAEPFFALLPTQDLENNEWVYDVSANVKFGKTPVPDDGDTVTRKVLKVWDDDGAGDSRPQEITVELLRNGKVYDTVKLSEKNNWRYTWLDLDADARWSVTEKTVSGYTVSITREGITFVVTNTKKPDRTDTPDTPVKPSNPSKPSSPAKPTLPQTGAVWWHVEALALSGLVFLILGALDRKTEA